MGAQAAVLVDLDPEENQTKAKKRSRKPNRQEREQLIIDTQDEGLRLAWKLLKQWRVRLNFDEVQSIVGIALCEAASRFDFSYNTAFRTFFYYHLRGLLLKEISSRINNVKMLQLMPTISSGEDTHLLAGTDYSNTLVERETPEKLAVIRERSGITRRAFEELDELEQQIIYRTFVEDESLTAIAKDLGYCRCHLSRVKTQALNSLADTLAPIAPQPERAKGQEVIKLSLRTHNYTGGRGRRRVVTKNKISKNKITKKAV